MNCIDAIEGIGKGIIDRFYDVYIEDRFDDTDFIRNIKTVIEAAEKFVRRNQELLSDPEILSRILYEYAKTRWMEHITRDPEGTDDATERIGYYNYYFDYIFNHGEYPR